MNIVKRNIKFWGENMLECIGIAAAGALILILFFCIGGSDFGGSGFAGMFWATFAVFPYYMIMAGAVVILVLTSSYCKIYLSLLISMGSTRREAALGILISMGAVIVGLVAIAAIVWSCLSGDVSADGLRLLPLLAGALLADGAIGLCIGVVIWRWGKIGMIIFTAVCMGAGGACGVLVVLSGRWVLDALRQLQFNFYPVLVGGGILYLLACIFTVVATRKIEI